MSVKIYKDGQLITISDADYAALNPPALDIPQVPASVMRLQGRLALNAANLLVQVEAEVAASDMATQIWYADAQNWERDNPIISALAAKLGITDQIDTLFTQAAAL